MAPKPAPGATGTEAHRRNWPSLRVRETPERGWSRAGHAFLCDWTSRRGPSCLPSSQTNLKIFCHKENIISATRFARYVLKGGFVRAISDVKTAAHVITRQSRDSTLCKASWELVEGPGRSCGRKSVVSADRRAEADFLAQTCFLCVPCVCMHMCLLMGMLTPCVHFCIMRMRVHACVS